jgi:adenosyl cobinamide kinase/adenosyl cobinamide phosphate guanylyltransferase
MGLVVLLGGARSGKSRLAVELAAATGGPVSFVASAEPRDAEMEERIAAHRRGRPTGWEVIEEPFELVAALESIDAGRVVVVDCLSIWVANAMERGAGHDQVLAAAERAAAIAAERVPLTVAVTNEVGLGVVPATPLGRAYRDVLGDVNRLWTAVSESALLVVAGRALPLAAAPELLSSALHRVT